MRLVLDTGVLGQVCHPRGKGNHEICDWFRVALTMVGFELYLPEISDYELRRKLLHLLSKNQADMKSIERLNQLGRLIDYIPIDTTTLRHAAQLWSEARGKGQKTASDDSLDGDVILAAQALTVEGTVLTNNAKHLGRFVSVISIEQVTSLNLNS